MPLSSSWRRLLTALTLVCAAGTATAADATPLDPTPRIGIVSAFGAEADLLLADLADPKPHTINGNRFTTGLLRGQPVVIVLTGIGLVNAAMTTQLLIDRFRIERLLMSGIAGAVNPERRVGDVTVPERWAMPFAAYWHRDGSVPAPCGAAGEVGCFGLKLARGADGKPLPPLVLAEPQGGAAVPTGLYPIEHAVRSARNPVPAAPEFRFDFPADAEMLAVARGLAPALDRCGPRATASERAAAAGAASSSRGGADAADTGTRARADVGAVANAGAGASANANANANAGAGAGAGAGAANCVRERPRLVVGGLGVSGPSFLANPQVRRYLHETLRAETVEMETAALAQVAYANGVPFLAFRSVSDLAGAEDEDGQAQALFASGLAEANEAAVTLAFLDAWGRRGPPR